MLPHIFNGNGTISIMIDGKMKPVDTAHKFYNEIKEAIKNQNWNIIPDLVNIKKQVEQAINNSTAAGKVTIDNGEVFYNGIRIHNTLTNTIISMAKDNYDIGHMVKFLENLMLNPSFKAVNELYDFLSVGAIPITENGTFLAYKKIRHDWKDIHSGTFDNSIGAICEMPRNMVDEDSSVTCSKGLHVCSYDYLPHFSSDKNDRVVICEINPADVVAIPQDYNNTKMRVCKYIVIGEVKDYKQENALTKNAVIFTNDITSGKTDGMVDHSKTPSSDTIAIAKNISALLQNETITPKILFNAIYSLKFDADFINDIEVIASFGDYKRVGKKLAKYCTINNINIRTLEQILLSLSIAVASSDDLNIPQDIVSEESSNDNLDDHIVESCKTISAMLEDSRLLESDLVTALYTITDDEDFIHSIEDCLNNCDFKRTGKKLAKAMRQKLFKGSDLLLAIMDISNDVTHCSRCGAELTGSDECLDCGFWNA